MSRCLICGTAAEPGHAESAQHAAAERRIWRDAVVQFLPGTAIEIMRRTRVGPEHAGFVEEVLAEMERDGEVRRTARGRWERAS